MGASHGEGEGTRSQSDSGAVLGLAADAWMRCAVELLSLSQIEQIEAGTPGRLKVLAKSTEGDETIEGEYNTVRSGCRARLRKCRLCPVSICAWEVGVCLGAGWLWQLQRLGKWLREGVGAACSGPLMGCSGFLSSQCSAVTTGSA